MVTRRGSVLGALVLLAAAATGCQFSTSGFRGGASGPQAKPGNVIVPSVFRMKREAALAALQDAGVQGSIADDTSLCGSVVDGQIIELGEVCYQHPVAGIEQPSSLPMTIRVQTEDPRHGRVGEHMEWHLMPALVGMPVAKAQQAMRDAGFTDEHTRITMIDEAGCKPLHVCRTTPEPLLREGQTSDRVLFVGADPTAKKATPPNLGDTPGEDGPGDKQPKPTEPTEPDPFF